MPENSISLLEKTFNTRAPDEKQLSPNVIAFARIYHAIDAGDLTVNGLSPDDNYSLGEYLIHGGRVRFDLSELNKDERQQFSDYLLNKQTNKQTNKDQNNDHIIKRKFASHLANGLDANGNIREIKARFRGLIFRARHLGINLPIGGEGAQIIIKEVPHVINLPIGGEGAQIIIKEVPHVIAMDGKWGHMYIHDDHANGFMMAGVENSAPRQRNLRTKRYHSMLSTSGNISPFLAERLDDKKWHERVRKEEKCPLTIESYNWACVKVTKANFQNIIGNPLPLDTPELRNKFTDRLKRPPQTAIPVTDPSKRLSDMRKFQKTTREQNSNFGKWSLGGGILLVGVGLFVSLSPFPPGMAQAIGAALLGVGIKTLAGVAITMSVPGCLGLVAFGLHQITVKMAQKSWNNVEKPPVSRRAYESPKAQPQIEVKFSSPSRLLKLSPVFDPIPSPSSSLVSEYSPKISPLVAGTVFNSKETRRCSLEALDYDAEESPRNNYLGFSSSPPIDCA